MIPTFSSTQSSRKTGAQGRRSVTIHTVECGSQGRRLVKTHVENRRKAYVEDDKYECYIHSQKKRRWSIALLVDGVR